METFEVHDTLCDTVVILAHESCCLIPCRTMLSKTVKTKKNINSYVQEKIFLSTSKCKCTVSELSAPIQRPLSTKYTFDVPAEELTFTC